MHRKGDGDIYRRWDRNCSKFDSETTKSISSIRFLQIKRVKKSNNNYEILKRDDLVFDPTHKFNLVYNYILKNLEVIIEKAILDQTVDKSSCAHRGYGEAGTRLVANIISKPGCSRGG